MAYINCRKSNKIRKTDDDTNIKQLNSAHTRIDPMVHNQDDKYSPVNPKSIEEIEETNVECSIPDLKNLNEMFLYPLDKMNPLENPKLI